MEQTKVRRHQWTRMAFQRVEPLVVEGQDAELFAVGEEMVRVGCMACNSGFKDELVDAECPGEEVDA